MMLYLAGSTRPDIAFAVHQGTHFSHNPRQSHEFVLKYIARYLKGARTKSLIMVLGEKIVLDLYAESDFAGLFQSDDVQDHISVKSWSGILLNFGNLPIHWSSKLQTEIAYSTLKSEYMSLSQGMRELAITRQLVQELNT